MCLQLRLVIVLAIHVGGCRSADVKPGRQAVTGLSGSGAAVIDAASSGTDALNQPSDARRHDPELLVDPPPETTIYDEDARAAEIEASRAHQRPLNELISALTDGSSTASSFSAVLAEPQSVERSGDTTRTQWHAVETLSGATVPSSFTLVESHASSAITESELSPGGKRCILFVVDDGGGEYHLTYQRSKPGGLIEVAPGVFRWKGELTEATLEDLNAALHGGE